MAAVARLERGPKDLYGRVDVGTTVLVRRNGRYRV